MTENNLLKFAEECDGTFQAIIVRAGYFFPSSTYPADARNQRSTASRWTDKLLGPTLATTLPSLYTPVNDMAKFAVEAVKGRWEPRGNFFRNVEMRKILKEEGIGGAR